MPAIRLVLCLWLCGTAFASCKRSPAPSLNTPAVLQGHVSAGRGVSVAGLKITIRQANKPGGTLAAVTRTDNDGRFRIAGIAPGQYTVESNVLGQAATVSLALQAGETLSTVLRLREPVRLVGQVEDRNGNPVPAALVLVWASGQAATQARETTTDEKGTFVFPQMTPGNVTLLVQAPGIGSVKWDPVPVPSRVLHIPLQGVGLSLAGAVSGPKGLAPQATVRLGGAALRNSRTATTDAAGRFIFHGLGPGDYALRAGSIVLASPTRKAVIVEASLDNIDLVMGQGEVVSGNVVDGSRKALTGATVVVQSVPIDDCPEVLEVDVVGYFSTIALPRGSYQALARMQGFVAEPAQPVSTNGRPPVLSIQLFRAGRVAGRVVTPGGAPAVGAEVSLTTPSGPNYPRDRLPVVAGNLPLAAEAAALGTQLLPHVMRTRSVTADAKGAFELGELRPGSYGLSARLWETGHLSVPPRTVKEGTATDFGTLKLVADPQPAPVPPPAVVRPQKAGGIEGEIVDERGRFVHKAQVSLQATDGAVAPAVQMSGAGFRALGVPAGPWTLVVQAPHLHKPVTQTIDIPPSDSPRVASLRGLRVTIPSVP